MGRPIFLLTLALGVLAAAPGQGEYKGEYKGEHESKQTLNRLAGPVSAEVLRVIDGDTIEVRAHVWLGQEVTTLVRIAGIDTPELRGKCPAERIAARRAAETLTALLANRRVTLHDIRFEKYAGRVMSRVETERGDDLGATLTAGGLARPYGGAARSPWCTTG